MEYFRYIIGYVLIALGCFVILTNYARHFENYLNKKKKIHKWSSPAPFFGPIFIILGYLILPIVFNFKIFWIFLLDIDTVMIILGIPFLIKE